MERGDIGPYAPLQLAVVFDGLLAKKPEGTRYLAAAAAYRLNNYDKYMSHWKPNELPIKFIVDAVNRRNIGVSIYTFLNPILHDALDRWLVRRNITIPPIHVEDAKEIAETVKYFPGIRQVFVPDQEQAAIIGIKATVVSADKAWSL